MPNNTQLQVIQEVPSELARRKFIELFGETLEGDTGVVPLSPDDNRGSDRSLDATGTATFEGPAQTPVSRLSLGHRQWVAYNTKRVASAVLLALLMAAPAMAEDSCPADSRNDFPCRTEEGTGR